MKNFYFIFLCVTVYSMTAGYVAYSIMETEKDTYEKAYQECEEDYFEHDESSYYMDSEEMAKVGYEDSEVTDTLWHNF